MTPEQKTVSLQEFIDKTQQMLNRNWYYNWYNTSTVTQLTLDKTLLEFAEAVLSEIKNLKSTEGKL